MTPVVFIARTNSKVPHRRIVMHHYKLGTEYVLDFDVVCTQNSDEARLACDQAGWLWVSIDAGTTYYQLPASAQAGYQFGPITAGTRQAIKLKVLIPVGTNVRRRFVALNWGMGDGSTSHVHWGDIFTAWESVSDNWEDIA